MQDNIITELLGLKDIKIKGVTNSPNLVEIFIENNVRAHKCPNCQSITSKIHDYRNQKVKDISILIKPVILVIRKRRYVCKHCNKRFYENIYFLGRYKRMSTRLIGFIIDRLRENYSMKSVARECRLSISTVIRVFDLISYTNKELPSVISIDEFKGTTDKGKYQCIIADPVNKRVLDILPDRELVNVKDYLKSFKSRENVQYVVMDMWEPYKLAVKRALPNAQIVIDKFHFIRHNAWAIERVRKEVQENMPDHLRKYMKKSKKLLLAKKENLSAESKHKLAHMLELSNKLRKAYILKEKFYWVMKAENSKKARRRLNRWYKLVNKFNLPQYNYMVNTIKNWEPEILLSFDVPYTNGCIEGFNNKIKVIKRNAFGYKRFTRFRNRILHCCF